MMRCWRSVAAVLVSACLLAAGCAKKWTWEDAMQALRDDPMASASWEGLELIGTIEEVNDRVKPPPPGIHRCYTLTIPPEEAMEKVEATAKEHGWVEDVNLRTPAYVDLSKKVGRTKASLTASMDVYGSDAYSCKEMYPEFQLELSLFYF